MNENWKVRKRSGAIYGPVDTETLKRWIQENRVLADDYISLEDRGDWQRINSFPQFAYLFEAQETSAEKRCIYCGSIIPAEAVLCINCGTDLRTGKKITGAQIKKQKKKSPLGIILILLILAIGGFFAYKYWGAFLGVLKKGRQTIKEEQKEQPSTLKPEELPKVGNQD
jgi:hypothetical protein